jgi:hypothetical protein
MPDHYLFEYAVIRVVPRVEREEFLNAGVIVYCRDKKFLKAIITLNRDKLMAICESANFEEIENYLCIFKKVSEGLADAGPIGRLDIASRFRWLTATRSTVVQSSKIHPGFCVDPGETLERLHRQLVL